MPCVFWDHLFHFKEDICAMIELRTRVGLHSRSSVANNMAEADCYIATIDDKCAPALSHPEVVAVFQSRALANNDCTLTGQNCAAFTLSSRTRNVCGWLRH